MSSEGNIGGSSRLEEKLENGKTAIRLSLIKGEHRYVIKYAPGLETDVIDALAVLASNPKSEFDWFDAAVLSYQMGRRLEMELDKLNY